jgi:hypothetical protein
LKALLNKPRISLTPAWIVYMVHSHPRKKNICNKSLKKKQTIIALEHTYTAVLSVIITDTRSKKIRHLNVIDPNNDK